MLEWAAHAPAVVVHVEHRFFEGADQVQMEVHPQAVPCPRRPNRQVDSIWSHSAIRHQVVFGIALPRNGILCAS
jgi:hypothetical protein